jgi:hypothetical protein
VLVGAPRPRLDRRRRPVVADAGDGWNHRSDGGVAQSCVLMK